MDERKIVVREKLLWLPHYHRLFVTPGGITVETTRKVNQYSGEIEALLDGIEFSKQWLVAYHHPGQPLTVTIGSIVSGSFKEEAGEGRYL